MTKKLSWPVLLGFGQLAVPLAVAGLPMTLFVPAFYTGELGLDLSAVGWALMLARLTDVVTDPLMGWISDRTPPAYGRRKGWTLAGVPVMMAGSWVLFFPLTGGIEALGWVYMLLAVALFYLGWTIVTIPYVAWGAELSPDYAERNRVTGVREIFALLGLIAAAVIQFLASPGGQETTVAPAIAALGAIALVSLPVSGVIIAATAPEPRPHRLEQPDFLRGLKIAARNKPFLRLLGATMVGRLGSKINETVAFWFFGHALGLGSGGAALLVMIFLIAAVVGAPFWIWAGGRFSKHRALAAAMAYATAVFALVPFVPVGGFWPMAAILTITGLGASASTTLGQSIAADVIDYDALKAREPRAGLLFAFWGMGLKGADALAMGAALWMLDALGYLKEMPPAEAWGPLIVVYCLVPLVFFAASAAIFWNYPITPERHARIRRILARRAARAAAPQH